MQKNDGRWWLLAPEVHGLFGIGLSHPLNKKPISLAPQTSLSGHYVAELRSPSGSFNQTRHLRLIEKGRTSNASAAPH